ncbi:hypothetical protein ABEF95_005249 [Exophiala dermatitidis]
MHVEMVIEELVMDDEDRRRPLGSSAAQPTYVLVLKPVLELEADEEVLVKLVAVLADCEEVDITAGAEPEVPTVLAVEIGLEVLVKLVDLLTLDGEPPDEVEGRATVELEDDGNRLVEVEFLAKLDPEDEVDAEVLAVVELDDGLEVTLEVGLPLVVEAEVEFEARLRLADELENDVNDPAEVELLANLVPEDMVVAEVLTVVELVKDLEVRLEVGVLLVLEIEVESEAWLRLADELMSAVEVKEAEVVFLLAVVVVGTLEEGLDTRERIGTDEVDVTWVMLTERLPFNVVKVEELGRAALVVAEPLITRIKLSEAKDVVDTSEAVDEAVSLRLDTRNKLDDVDDVVDIPARLEVNKVLEEDKALLDVLELPKAEARNVLNDVIGVDERAVDVALRVDVAMLLLVTDKMLLDPVVKVVFATDAAVDVLPIEVEADSVDKTVVVLLGIKLAERELALDGTTYWYRDNPFGPPHTVDEFPAHVMEQRPSVAVVDPADRVFPQ